MGRRSEQCGRVAWYSTLVLFLVVSRLTVSQITYSSGGELDCRDIDCQGKSILFTAGQAFALDCGDTDTCRGSDIIVQAGCTLSDEINCDLENSCRDSTLTVYDSDLSDDKLDCQKESTTTTYFGSCKDMIITLWGDSSLELECGRDSWHSCVGMEVHVHNTSHLRMKSINQGTQFTIYLYDQGTVDLNGNDITVITQSPTVSPTSSPTKSTGTPTIMPTSMTIAPTENPTGSTNEPTVTPSQSPTSPPTVITEVPSEYPTLQPTLDPTTTIDPESGEDSKKSGGSDTDMVLVLVSVMGTVIVMLSLIVCGFVTYHCFCKPKMNPEGNKASQLARMTSLSSIDQLGEGVGQLQTDTNPVFLEEDAPASIAANPRFHSSMQIEGESGVEVPMADEPVVKAPVVDEDEPMYENKPRITTKGATKAGASSVDAIRDEDEHELMYMNVRSKGGPTPGTYAGPPPKRMNVD